jgi:hypothetical protein
MSGIGTTAWRLPNGKVLIPQRVEEESGLIGDGYIEVDGDSEEAREWADWTEDAPPAEPDA